MAAVLDLVARRGGRRDEAGDAISVLVSLLAEGECWLPELVADARDQRYSWDAIATRLVTTISAARHRAASSGNRRDGVVEWRRRRKVALLGSPPASGPPSWPASGAPSPSG